MSESLPMLVPDFSTEAWLRFFLRVATAIDVTTLRPAGASLVPPLPPPPLAIPVERCPRCSRILTPERVCVRCADPGMGVTLRWFEEGRGRGGRYHGRGLRYGFRALADEGSEVWTERHYRRRKRGAREDMVLRHNRARHFAEILNHLYESPYCEPRWPFRGDGQFRAARRVGVARRLRRAARCPEVALTLAWRRLLRKTDRWDERVAARRHSNTKAPRPKAPPAIPPKPRLPGGEPTVGDAFTTAAQLYADVYALRQCGTPYAEILGRCTGVKTVADARRIFLVMTRRHRAQEGIATCIGCWAPTATVSSAFVPTRLAWNHPESYCFTCRHLGVRAWWSTEDERIWGWV